MNKKSKSSQFHRRWHRTLKRMKNTALHESHPTVKAHYVWRLVSEQLVQMIGEAPFQQWFSSVQPLLLVDQILVLQTQNKFACQWINQHYRELVDALLSAQDAKYCCYFISLQDIGMLSPLWQNLIKGATSKIDGEGKDDNSKNNPATNH